MSDFSEMSNTMGAPGNMILQDSDFGKISGSENNSSMYSELRPEIVEARRPVNNSEMDQGAFSSSESMEGSNISALFRKKELESSRREDELGPITPSQAQKATNLSAMQKI